MPASIIESPWTLRPKTSRPPKGAIHAHRVDHVLFGEQRKAGGDATEDEHLDEVDVVGRLGRDGGAVAGGLDVGGTQGARLHVLPRQITLALQGAQVVVDAVRRPDPHARADLSERWRVTAVVNRLADEVEDHLLALSQPLHRAQTLPEHVF